MSRQAKHFYEFGPFRVDERERRLLRDGEAIPLPPKVFETLLALVRNSGHLLTKDELLQTVWPGTFVEENNLTQYVSALRKTLGDDGNGGYIETVPRVGYRFAPGVREVWDEANGLVVENRARYHLVIKEEEHEEIEDEEQTVGARSTPIALPAPRRRTRAKQIALAASILIVLSAAVLLLIRTRKPEPGAETVKPPAFKSIAVLPFKLIGAGGESEEHLGLGLADLLITKLGHIRQINVRPTSAVQKYTSDERDLEAIGRELKVDAVLDGRIQKAGERLRVTVQLVSVRDGTPLWTESLEEEFTNIFTAQDAIAARVIRGLAPVLTEQEREQLAKRYTNNPEAYEAYLKGRYFWNKRTVEGIRKSTTYFQQAIDKDPNFALAHAGLADVYLISEALKFEPAIRKALELDDKLGEAHASLGFDRMFWHWDWEGAEREFKLALELNPNYPTAHQWYAIYLALRGRFDEAKAEMRQALELDPLSPNMNADMGQLYYFAREYDQAIAQCRKALEIDPDSMFAHQYLYYVYAQKGAYADAVEEYLKFIKAEELRGPTTAASLREAYAASGWRGFLQTILKSSAPRDSPTLMAMTYAMLADKEQAFKQLERAYDTRDFYLGFIKVEPTLDGLSADPRFADLLRRMKLTP